MKGKTERELTPQEQLAQLREEREFISEQMKGYNLADPDQSGFADLLRRAASIEEGIEKLQDLIEPERGHGTIGEDTLNSSRGPEPDRWNDK